MNNDQAVFELLDVAYANTDTKDNEENREKFAAQLCDIIDMNDSCTSYECKSAIYYLTDDKNNMEEIAFKLLRWAEGMMEEIQGGGQY